MGKGFGGGYGSSEGVGDIGGPACWLCGYGFDSGVVLLSGVLSVCLFVYLFHFPSVVWILCVLGTVILLIDC